MKTIAMTSVQNIRRLAALLGTLLILCFGFTPTAQADDSLYKALGEKSGIEKITHDFYLIITADPRIKTFFVETEPERFEGLLSEQFCQLAGGPCKYNGRSMKEVHKGMGVQPAHFNALAEGLQLAMEKNKVTFAAQNALIAKLAPMNRDVIQKP
jgi:hemoglobin